MKCRTPIAVTALALGCVYVEAVAQSLDASERAAPAMRLATTVIYVDNVKEVLDFYSRALGVEIRYYDEALEFGELELAGANIMIGSHKAGEFMMREAYRPFAARRPQNLELAFITDDVDRAYARAVAAGAKPILAPEVKPWGQKVAYAASIEGTIIGFLTEPPRR